MQPAAGDAAAEYWAAVLPLEEAHGVPGSYSAHSRVEEGKLAKSDMHDMRM